MIACRAPYWPERIHGRAAACGGRVNVSDRIVPQATFLERLAIFATVARLQQIDLVDVVEVSAYLSRGIDNMISPRAPVSNFVNCGLPTSFQRAAPSPTIANGPQKAG
jgi:hypothetical protein